MHPLQDHLFYKAVGTKESFLHILPLRNFMGRKRNLELLSCRTFAQLKKIKLKITE